MKNILGLGILVFLCTQSIAQNINVVEEPSISRLITHHIEMNRNTNRVSGWRVQLMSTTDRRKVEDAKRKFMADHPGIPVDWTHSKPYYRLRAGAFATQLESLRILHILKKDYASAFAARDNNIYPRDLINYY